MSEPIGAGYGYPPAPRETLESSHHPEDSLVEQLTALYQEKQELQAVLGASTAAEIIELVRSGNSQEMLQSLTDQLASLYSENQELEAAIGCSSATEISSLVHDLRASIRILVDDARRRLQYEATLLDTHERFLA